MASTLGEMLSACSLNGACGKACPVRIPIPSLISELRHEATRNDKAGTVYRRGALRKLHEALVWGSWKWIHRTLGLQGHGLAATRLRRLCLCRHGTPPKPGEAALAEKTLHELMKERNSRARETEF